VFGSLQRFLGPVPTGPRGEILLSEDAALEQLLLRSDEAWKHWVAHTLDPNENTGSVADQLWQRMNEAEEGADG
jgi:hypothetical protein